MPWLGGRKGNQQSKLFDDQHGSASWNLPLMQANYFVIDIETSGFSPQTDIVLSVASAPVCLLDENPLANLHYELVGHANTTMVPPVIWELTGLSPDDLRDQREWRDILYSTLQLSASRVWVAYHARHELSFLQKHARELWKLRLTPIVIDAALVAQALFGTSTVPTLDEACKQLGIPVGTRHRADEDVRMTVALWRQEVSLCEAIGLKTVGQVVEWTLARVHG